jgi:hypothetical protein
LLIQHAGFTFKKASAKKPDLCGIEITHQTSRGFNFYIFCRLNVPFDFPSDNNFARIDIGMNPCLFADNDHPPAIDVAFYASHNVKLIRATYQTFKVRPLRNNGL